MLNWARVQVGTADFKVSADDGKGMVLSLLRTREGSNILAEAYHYICLLHFEIFIFRGGARGGGTVTDGGRVRGRWGGWRICSKVFKPFQNQAQMNTFSKFPEA